MTEYPKTELDPGVAAIKGELHKVTERNDASEFSFGDAQFFQRQASERWHDLVWETEPVREGEVFC
jgi:hypothetical protein